MKKQILLAALLGALPVYAAAQTENNISKIEDPRMAQQRAEMEAEMKTRMEAERAFIKTLEGKTPEERVAAIKARHEQHRQAAEQKSGAGKSEPARMEDPRMAKQRAEMEAEMKTRMEAERAFIKTLEGKTPEERVSAIKSRHEQQRQAAAQKSGAGKSEPARIEDPRMAKQRAEMEAEMKTRMEAERAFIKTLEGKTPEERVAAIKARHEQQR